VQGLLKGSLIQNFPITLKQTSKCFALVGFSIALLACGGGSSSGGLPSTPEAIGKVQGTAYIGVVQEGDIKVYEFKNGVRGAAINSTTVNPSDGSYSLNLQTPSKSILVCLDKAAYTEITSSNTVFFTDTQELCAVENYFSGETTTVSITYYSHIATGLATRLLDFNVATQNAVNDANDEIKHWVGYNINKTIPANINLNTSTETLTDLKAGFANAAISVYTGWVNGVSGIPPGSKRHITYNSILFAQRAFEDIVADGALDGQSENGPTGLGAVGITTKTYRLDIAKDMLVMVNNGNNNSSIQKSSDLFGRALQYSEFDHPNTSNSSSAPSTLNIFGESLVGDLLSNTTPIMNNFIIPKVVTGDVIIASSVTDVVGQLVSIEYRIKNPTIQGLGGVGTILDDQIGFVDTNIKADLTRTGITFSSTSISPSIGAVYPDDKNYIINIIARYTDIATSGTTVVILKSPDKKAIIGNTGTSVEGLSPKTQITVNATPVDTTPIATVTGTFNLFSGVSNPLGVSSVELKIDNLPLITAGNFDATAVQKYAVPIFRINTRTVNGGVALADGEHDFVLTAVGDPNGANQSITTTFKYNVDNTPPILTVTPPTAASTSGWFTNNFNIGVATNDGVGSGVNNFKIIMDGGILKTVLAPSASVSNPFPLINGIPDGVHLVRVQATDNIGLTSFNPTTLTVQTDANVPTLTMAPLTLQTYTLPSQCTINVTAADPVGIIGGIGSGVKSVTVDGIFYGVITTSIQINLQNKITVAVGAVAQVINMTASVEDVAGHVTNKAITLTATQPILNNYTCQITVN